MPKGVDDRLMDWKDVAKRHVWTGLLIGNGASRAVWDRFKYDSLYESACKQVTNPLTATDQTFFNEMGTRNFEQVLAGLATARIVCDALKMDVRAIVERYESIRNALFRAVSAVHIPWSDDDVQVYQAIGTALQKFDFVYSTNYDLLVYWSIMAKEGDGFKDYLWNGEFDPNDTRIWGDVTKVLYLHGGIHLVRRATGETAKRQGGGGNLIETLAHVPAGDVPLFITEGSSTHKLASIYRSDYLAFAYQQFASHAGPLVVFGQSLSESDQHLVNAMGRWGAREIAIGIYPTNSNDIIAFKADLKKRLPEAQLMYFDSQTHPLGNARLRIG